MNKKRLFLMTFMLLLVVVFMPNKVYAATLNDASDFPIWSVENGSDNEPFYAASGTKVEFFINPDGFSYFQWGDFVVENKKPVSIAVEFSTSSNANCTLSEISNSTFSFSGNKFTLTDQSASSFDGSVGKISCSLPTTNDYIPVSSNNFIRVKLTEIYRDYAPTQPTDETHVTTVNMTFGIINRNYLNSLSSQGVVTNVYLDGNDVTNSTEAIETTSEYVKFKVATNGNANSLKYMYIHESYEDPKQLTPTNGEVTVQLPYGLSYIYVEDTPPKEAFLDSIEFGADKYGFGDDEFSYIGEDTKGVMVKRLDTRSKVNTLSSLTISNAKIDFKPELKFYNVTVKNDVQSVTIKSTLTDSKSSYVDGYGNRTVNLNEGKNTIIIKVRAEHGEEAEYSITVTREESDDATLKELIVNGKTLKIEKDVLKYSLNVNNEVTKVEIKATANHPKATVTVDEVGELKEGDNEIKITVEAANKEKKIYKLTIKRDGSISNNSNLKELKVKGYDIDFSQNIKTYNLKIEDETELDITAKADHEKAKILITGNKDLKHGSIIKIKVTAEDETTTTYEIIIEKEQKKTNPLLFIVIIGAIIIPIVIIVAIVIILKNKKKKDIVKDEKNVQPESVENTGKVEKSVQSESEDNTEKVDEENGQ